MNWSKSIIFANLFYEYNPIFIVNMNRIINSKYFVFLLPIVVLLAVSFYLYPEWINLPPSYVHQWAQADWYAMAMCYAKEDIVFSLPRTYALNTNFVNPSHWGQGITRADFPIHAYISGIIMYYTNTFEPYIFRTYTLIYSLIGMIFLFRLIYDTSKSQIWALCAMLVVFTSPVYAYYQVGFQPVVPSFANFVIALYFFYTHFKQKKESLFYLAVIFITLSALSRPSFAVYWVAFLLFVLWNSYKVKSFKLYHYGAFLLSFALQLGSYLYNVGLKKEYGAMFIDYPLPASTITTYFNDMYMAMGAWRFDYLSHSQYVVMLIVVAITISLIASKGKLSSESKMALILLAICFLGAFSFTVLMSTQFPDHDYYSIDVLMPVLVVIFLAFSEIISSEQENSTPFAFGILATCFMFNISDCKAVLDSRSSKDGKNEYEAVRAQYKDSGKFLDQLRVPKDAKLLVLNSFTFNIPMLEMGRKGYPIIYTAPDSVKKALNYAYEYAVIRTNDVAHMLTVCPSMITKLEKIGSNNLITVYKNRRNLAGNILSFYGVDEGNVLLADTSSFDILPKKAKWEILPERISKRVSFSSPKSLFVDSLDFIGPMVTFENTKPLLGKRYLNVILRMKTLYPKTNKSIRLAYEVYYKSGKTFESEEILREEIKGSKWQNASCSIKLQLTNTQNIKKVILFLWNSSKISYSADDIETYVYTE